MKNMMKIIAMSLTTSIIAVVLVRAIKILVVCFILKQEARVIVPDDALSLVISLIVMIIYYFRKSKKQ